MQQLPLAIRLRERADFDSFVTGPNVLAVEQLRAALPCQQQARGGGEPRSSRVYWLSGPKGSGKSHLLQASCSQTLGYGCPAQYLPLSQVLSFGPSALAEWSGARLLALDELTVAVGQRDWEEALFALYRDCEQRDTLLLVAAEQSPAQLSFALPDLASRFAAAMRLQLQPLDEASQCEALQRRARARGLELPEDVAHYLQRHFRRDLVTLCEVLDTIDSASLQAQRRLTIPFIRDVLAARATPAAE